MSYFWRKWNLPVHNFLRVHVFEPLWVLGVPRPIAMIIVFFFSAVRCASGGGASHHPPGVSRGRYLGPVQDCALVRVLGDARSDPACGEPHAAALADGQIATEATRRMQVVGNILFWAGMGLGQGIMTLMVPAPGWWLLMPAVLSLYQAVRGVAAGTTVSAHSKRFTPAIISIQLSKTVGCGQLAASPKSPTRRAAS